jgi:hypothetical protein
LDLVDDDQTVEGLQCRQRLVEERPGARVLEIEVGGLARIEELAGKRGLSTLAWTSQDDARERSAGWPTGATGRRSCHDLSMTF